MFCRPFQLWNFELQGRVASLRLTPDPYPTLHSGKAINLGQTNGVAVDSIVVVGA